MAHKLSSLTSQKHFYAYISIYPQQNIPFHLIFLSPSTVGLIRWQAVSYTYWITSVERQSAYCQRDKHLTFTQAPAETRRWIIAGFMLVHRPRRWTNFKPPLIKRLVSAVEMLAGWIGAVVLVASDPKVKRCVTTIIHAEWMRRIPPVKQLRREYSRAKPKGSICLLYK